TLNHHPTPTIKRKFPPFRAGARKFHFTTLALSRFPTLTRLIPITLNPVIARNAAQHNPPVIARNAAQRNDEAISPIYYYPSTNNR
ncbi:hypothetical protein AAH994_15765, partial [Weeksellaceae bacterium A-14]